MGLSGLHIVKMSSELPVQLMTLGLLVKESSPYQLVRQCEAHADNTKVTEAHSGSSTTRDAQWSRRPSGGSVSDTLATPLLRYLWNGLELFELTDGGASGTDPGHGKP